MSPKIKLGQARAPIGSCLLSDNFTSKLQRLGLLLPKHKEHEASQFFANN